MPNLTPTRKIGTTGAAGALSIVLVWLINDRFHTDLPAEVASAITLLIAAAAGYLTPQKPN